MVVVVSTVYAAVLRLANGVDWCHETWISVVLTANLGKNHDILTYHNCQILLVGRK